MQHLIAFYLLAAALLVVFVMMRDSIRGRVDLVSIRNFALVGFIVFQLTSGAIALISDGSGRFGLEDLTGTGVDFAARCTVFLLILLLFYRWGVGATKLAHSIPTTKAIPPEAFMWVVAAILVFVAAGLRLGVRIPLVGVLSQYLGDAFAAIACGIAGWIWAKRFFNPIAIVYSLLILASCSAIVVYGSFGRRGLLTVGTGLVWGMFYSRLRYSNPRRILLQIVAVGAIPAIVLALFTSVRSSFERERTAAQHLQAMVTQGDVVLGFALLLNGQEAGQNSMWLIEKFPESFEYQWFQTPIYFVAFPVPRNLWPDKPVPLSRQIPTLAAMQGVDRRELTIGPGIIGHAAAEGGWITTVVYAVLGGLFLRFFDEIVRRSVYSPFVVLPVGAALGQVIALARGETSMFAFIYTFAVAGSYVCIVMLAKALEGIGLFRPAPVMEEEEWHADPEEDSEFSTALEHDSDLYER